MAYHNTPVTYDPALGLCATPGVPLNIALNARPNTPVVAVNSSRALTAADNGMHLECTATVTLTVPSGLPAGFRCDVIPNGTTSIATSGGALVNGAGTTLTRLAATAANAIVTIAQRASAANSYVVTGS